VHGRNEVFRRKFSEIEYLVGSIGLDGKEGCGWLKFNVLYYRLDLRKSLNKR
jgi:hypothetical protein